MNIRTKISPEALNCSNLIIDSQITIHEFLEHKTSKTEVKLPEYRDGWNQKLTLVVLLEFVEKRQKIMSEFSSIFNSEDWPDYRVSGVPLLRHIGVNKVGNCSISKEGLNEFLNNVAGEVRGPIEQKRIKYWTELDPECVKHDVSAGRSFLPRAFVLHDLDDCAESRQLEEVQVRASVELSESVSTHPVAHHHSYRVNNQQGCVPVANEHFDFVC